MDLQFGLEHDVWHRLRSPGAYEWWYFDAIDERGEYALVAIYSLGLPFSPHYREAVLAHRSGARPAPDPRDYALMSFTLYRRGRWEAYLLNEYPAERCETSPDRPLIRIAGSSAEWEPSDSGRGADSSDNPKSKIQNPKSGRFRLHIADTLLGGGEIEGDLTFSPMSLPHCTTSNGEAPGAHTWVVAAPACQVEGDLAIRRPGGASEVSFRGAGYHDHNYGAEDFTMAMRSWSWGRVHLPDATLVYYHVAPLAGLAPTQRLILVKHETGTVYPLDGALAPRGWRPNPFLLASPGVVGFRGATEGVELSGRACPRTVVDSGPFYLRFLADFEVTVRRDGVTCHHQGPGFAEYLQPARLDWRWTWPMLKTRFIRSTG